MESLKVQHLFEIEVLIVFITFNQFNGSILNVLTFFKNNYFDSDSSIVCL